MNAGAGLLLALAPAILPSSVGVAAVPPTSAREGSAIAAEAARAWAPDAYLVYLENDEPLNGTGRAERWGYLFYSPSRDAARGYSVEGERIVVAGDPGFEFDAPPLSEGWIDSGAVLAAAERGAGARFRREHGGEIRAIYLMRAGLQERKPDMTTWTVVYDAPGVASLFVVVDAASGKVTRKWRG